MQKHNLPQTLKLKGYTRISAATLLIWGLVNGDCSAHKFTAGLSNDFPLEIYERPNDVSLVGTAKAPNKPANAWTGIKDLVNMSPVNTQRAANINLGNEIKLGDLQVGGPLKPTQPLRAGWTLRLEIASTIYIDNTIDILRIYGVVGEKVLTEADLKMTTDEFVKTLISTFVMLKTDGTVVKR